MVRKVTQTRKIQHTIIPVNDVVKSLGLDGDLRKIELKYGWWDGCQVWVVEATTEREE